MQNKIIIRQANLKDLNEIVRLNFALFAKEYKDFDKSLNLKWSNNEGKSYFKDKICQKDGFVWVAEDEKKIVGYLCGGICDRKDYRKKAKYAELENIFIADQYRSQGLGRKLVDFFIKWCKAKKVNYISVTASANNKLAIDFYQKHGFKDYDLTLEMLIKES
jgi:ribosomal protein S18 acetylase RimI-like enzyme